MAQGYTARIATGVVRRAPRRPSSLLTAVGEGLADLGETGSRIAEQNARTEDAIADSNARIEAERVRRAQSAAIATGAGRWADLQLEAEKAIAEARTKNPDPGAAGHEAAATGIADKAATDLMSSLPDDPEVRERFAPLIASWRARTIGGESAWEIGQRAKFQGTSIGKLMDAQSASQIGKPDPKVFDTDELAMKGMIDAMDVPAAARAEIWQKYLTGHAQSLLDGLLNTGQPAAARAVLESGQFDARLGDGKDAYLGRVASAEALIAKQTEAAQAEVLAGALDKLKAIRIRIDGGKDVPQSEINAALTAAQQAGAKESDLTEYGFLGQQAEAARAVRGQSSQVLQAQRDTLLAKRQAGKATDDDVRALEAIDKELDGRDEKAGVEIGTLWKQGGPGQAEAVRQLAALPPQQRYAAAAKFSMKAFVIASLPADKQAQVLQGQAIRQARGDDFLPPKAAGRDPKWIVDQTMRSALGPSVVRSLAGQFDEVRETALDLFATVRNDGNGNRWSEQVFRHALNTVMGGTVRRDGTYQGGIGTVRGRTIELPSGWSAKEFSDAYSGLGFAGAYYGDGKTLAKKADILANFTPVVDHEDDDGTVSYRLEDSRGRPLQRQNRGTYLVRVKRSPRAGGR